MTTAKASAKIVNVRGLHARAASKVCQVASAFEARITLSKGGTAVGARSLMALLMLGAGIGSEVEIAAEGSDAEAAVETIKGLIEDRFGEDE